MCLANVCLLRMLTQQFTSVASLFRLLVSDASKALCRNRAIAEGIGESITLSTVNWCPAADSTFSAARCMQYICVLC